MFNMQAPRPITDVGVNIWPSSVLANPVVLHLQILVPETARLSLLSVKFLKYVLPALERHAMQTDEQFSSRLSVCLFCEGQPCLGR